MVKPQIIVLDFGGQYAHLIARRCRELGVSSKIMLPDTSTKKLEKARGLILSGGPTSILDQNAPKYNQKIFFMGKPVLGICYGHQLIASVFKGKLEQGKHREYGKQILTVKQTGIFEGLPKKSIVWMSHGDSVIKTPKNFSVTATTKQNNISAMQNISKKIFSVQFHPEVKHTVHGKKILSNFLFKYCKCKKNWSLKEFLKQKIEQVKKEVGDKKVFAFVSGGVDSMVGITLLGKALNKNQVLPVFVDTGLMRKKEAEQVKKACEKQKLNIKIVKKNNLFLSKLKKIVSAEKKRKIIGKLFLKIKKSEAKKMNLKKTLFFQGTIYPDTIESKGTKHSAKIKTHHNRIKEIQKLVAEKKIVEPLKELYKDEVRKMGLFLGLPKTVIERHPFPGPGLAVRIICSNKTNFINTGNYLNQKNFLPKKAIATILPLKSVGVQGDQRTYKNPLLLQEISLKKAKNFSRTIINNDASLNRVIVEVSSKKAVKLKKEKLFISKKTVSTLQKADLIVAKELKKTGLNTKIWQFPVVLLPISSNNSKHSIILRPVESLDGMTADSYILPKNVLTKIVKKIEKKTKIKNIFYDVTSKPPATIEWE